MKSKSACDKSVESKSMLVATINIKKTQLASIWTEEKLRRILENSTLKKEIENAGVEEEIGDAGVEEDNWSEK